MSKRKSLPAVACAVPRNLNWQRNASTGADIAQINRATRLVRTGRAGRYLYRAEYWGNFSLNFPIGSNAATPAQALRDLCKDVSRLKKRSK